MQSFQAKTGEVERKWLLVDLKGKALGRAASEIAKILRGKTKPTFTPHIDTGDFVVAINAAEIKLTGNKLADKKYYSHSGYIGGIKETNAQTLLKRHPEALITKAVWGMLPHNSMGRKLMKKFKVYGGDLHPHAAQQPQIYDLKI